MKLQEIKGGENESAGVSKGAVLLFLNQAQQGPGPAGQAAAMPTLGSWNCFLQVTTDDSISFHSRFQHL